MSNQQAMIDKVKGLMAMATDTRTPEAEREAAMNKALGLMSKYQIEESQLQNSDANDFITKRAAIEFDKGGPITRRLINLAHAIAQPMGLVLHYGSRRGGAHVTLYGRRSTIDNALMLYTALSADMLAQAKKQKAIKVDGDTWRDMDWEQRDLHAPPWYDKGDLRAKTNSIRSSFMSGYQSEIRRRISEMNEQVDAEHDGTFLPMLASDYQRANELAPKVPCGDSIRSGRGGHAAGRAAGAKASLGSTSMPSAPRALGA